MSLPTHWRAMSTASEQHLIEQLTKSDIYRDYERAFSAATGLPLALRPVESWRLAHHGKHHENPFCAMLAKCSQSCAACLNEQERICDESAHGPRTVVCFAGLSESSVPIRAGEKLLGFLQTGEVSVGKLTRRGFAKAARQLVECCQYSLFAGTMEACKDGGHFVLAGSNYQDVFSFLVLILVLVFRPSGLLGERVGDRA